MNVPICNYTRVGMNAHTDLYFDVQEKLEKQAIPICLNTN